MAIDEGKIEPSSFAKGSDVDDHPSVLPRVLVAAADVREGQRRQQVGDRTLTVGYAKALGDVPISVEIRGAGIAG